MVVLVSIFASVLQEPFNHFQSFSKQSCYTSPVVKSCKENPLKALVKEWPGRSWLEDSCPVVAGQSWRVGFSSPWCHWICAGLQAVGKDRHIPPSLERQCPLGTFASLHFENVDETDPLQGRVWEHVAGQEKPWQAGLNSAGALVVVLGWIQTALTWTQKPFCL